MFLILAFNNPVLSISALRERKRGREEKEKKVCGGGEKKRDYKGKRMRTKNDVSIYNKCIHTQYTAHIYIYNFTTMVVNWSAPLIINYSSCLNKFNPVQHVHTMIMCLHVSSAYNNNNHYYY